MAERKISAPRLRLLATSRGLKSQRDLAKFLKISESFLSEILSGKRTGERKAIDIATAFEVSMEYLTGGGQILIPMVAHIQASEPFKIVTGDEVELIDISQLPGLEKSGAAKRLYAVKVCDNSMLPIFKEGDVLIAARESRDEIKHGDRAIVCEDSSTCWVRFIEIVGNMMLARAVPSNVPEVIDATKLRTMDKIIYIVPS